MRFLRSPSDDGVTFEPAGLRAQVIRDADPYTGVWITVPARIDRARHPLRIDINVGDLVTPEPVKVSYPSLLDEPFELIVYPLETVLAEKIVTMIDRGDATTRDRDFADVFVLSGRHEVDAPQLAAAVRTTGAGSDHQCVEGLTGDDTTVPLDAWRRSAPAVAELEWSRADIRRSVLCSPTVRFRGAEDRFAVEPPDRDG